MFFYTNHTFKIHEHDLYSEHSIIVCNVVILHITATFTSVSEYLSSNSSSSWFFRAVNISLSSSSNCICGFLIDNCHIFRSLIYFDLNSVFSCFCFCSASCWPVLIITYDVRLLSVRLRGLTSVPEVWEAAFKIKVWTSKMSRSTDSDSVKLHLLMKTVRCGWRRPKSKWVQIQFVNINARNWKQNF